MQMWTRLGCKLEPQKYNGFTGLYGFYFTNEQTNGHTNGQANGRTNR